jgi:hypothetical protein
MIPVTQIRKFFKQIFLAGQIILFKLLHGLHELLIMEGHEAVNIFQNFPPVVH